MTEAVVVGNRKIRERAGGKAWQRSRAGKNYPDTRAIFAGQKLRTKQRDRFCLLGYVGADDERIIYDGRRFTAHLCFAEQSVARLPRTQENRVRFAQCFLPRADPAEIYVP